MKCKNCSHKEVCSKRESYEDIFDTISKKNTGEFEVDLLCKWFGLNPYGTAYKFNPNDGILKTTGIDVGTYPTCKL